MRWQGFYTRPLLVLLLVAALSWPLLSSSALEVLPAQQPTGWLVDPATLTVLPADEDLYGPLLRLASGENEALVAYRPVAEAPVAVLWLSGVDGGLDGPFDGFYSQMAEQMASMGVASAQLLYSAPGEFEQSVREALVALSFLNGEGISTIGVVGFSFGGAVAIAAAAEQPQVAAVVTLGSQAFGTERVSEIAPRPLLVVHPEGDKVMPVSVAQEIYDQAGPGKKLVVLPTSDHYLTDAPRVEGLVRTWLLRQVGLLPVTEGRSQWKDSSQSKVAP